MPWAGLVEKGSQAGLEKVSASLMLSLPLGTSSQVRISAPPLQGRSSTGSLWSQSESSQTFDYQKFLLRTGQDQVSEVTHCCASANHPVPKGLFYERYCSSFCINQKTSFFTFCSQPVFLLTVWDRLFL